MRTNTLVSHKMQVTYNPWTERLNPSDGLTYREYLESGTQQVNCSIAVSGVGGISLYADRELQSFGVIREMRDATGEAFMTDQWYMIQRVTPVMDAMGNRTSYRHQLAAVEGDIFAKPITPRPAYPDIDQVS